MQNLKNSTAALGLSALLMTTTAMGVQAAISATTTPASVVALNQKLEDGHLLVEYAYLPEQGYVAVYGSDKDGNPIRDSLGHAELAAGNHLKIKIKLDQAPPVGSKLWVSLYTDKDGKAGFDKKGDTALWQDSLPAANKIVVQ